ncbi:cytochrome c oxidase accessory protein CcoG [Janthinobacterium sp. B9-8]|uniref:cytochrome c oxidase accessory protein CcoG n=1 Tax=Janthinobacterium sp. B9-8 TaxID=1236179 RepID=UPI00061D18FD|nr:cytochrome c oxidase accessory protein CcoG [Janthinobacterium sp. B9-8]AMC35761.1 cytochrome c oxidase accessory protein CcoG [Janthinobacterium sp. B9-8]
MSAKPVKALPIQFYPRLTKGRFNNWRVLMIIITQLIFFGLPWIHWQGQQAVWFDLARQQFFVFGMNFWPQDFIYLMALMMAGAFALFFWSTLSGRIWCGYACPQTVYSTIMLWIDRLTEGSHTQRAKLDAAPWSAEKVLRKSGKHALMLLFCFWTGFSFVGYFSPIRDMAGSLPTLSFGPIEWLWIFSYGSFTYVLAGLLREQVCKHMCPYARFQSAMFDQQTLVVAYDAVRGEPRGAQHKATAAQGDCVNCNICVQVCPVGIDIRQGLQYECIGCAACIDACDVVMDKIEKPRGLIRFTNEQNMQKPGAVGLSWQHLMRPRAALYGLAVVLVLGIASVSLMQRQPLKLDIARDRNILARETDRGWLENSYTLQLGNSSATEQHLELTVEGLPGVEIYSDEPVIALPAGSNRQITVRLEVAQSSGSVPIVFTAKSRNHPAWKVSAQSSFLALHGT